MLALFLPQSATIGAVECSIRMRELSEAKSAIGRKFD
jgi:hypothetical protein